MDATRDLIPSDVTLSEDRQGLTLTWGPLDRTTLGAEALRLTCRCAWCRRDRILACFPERFDDVVITHVEAVGVHALHIVFSDGHARGLYPWIYLRDIADGVVMADGGLAATSLPGCPTLHDAHISQQDSP